MKRYTKKWEDILYITLLIIGFVFLITAAIFQSEYCFKAFLICVVAVCILYIAIMTLELVKAFKSRKKDTSKNLKFKTLMFWLDILFILSGMASYLLLAFSIYLMNILLLNICVISVAIYIVLVIAKIILITMQSKTCVKDS